MTVLYINELIAWSTEDTENQKKVERILWVDENNIIIYTIDVNDNEITPIMRKVSEISDALENNSASRLKEDPFMKIMIEDEIHEKHKALREQAWSAIEDLVSPENEYKILKDRRIRSQLVRQAAQEHNVTDKVIYKYLKKYWKRGKNKNALLPDFDKCGGKGKEKMLGEKKIGRPRKNAFIIGDGINVDEATKKIFRVAISKYYLTQKENPLTTAYDLMIKEFYSEDYRLVNGIKKSVIIPPEQIPTFTQFRYWYNKEQNIKKTIQSRKGSKKFELNHRATTGKSDADIIGPGSKYQIDATVGDIYLVSRYNRNWIVGRPVIYVVIDMFSRMITGLYVGLEGPSWIGAMMALTNATTDKTKFCKEYDIDIIEEDWPCYHLPESILADRGEMEGKDIDTFINTLHVRIENTPPYRADWKGIVEQYFKTINTKVKPLVPGYIDVDFRERGGRDYRLDAKLDIYQFTQIIIKCVLYHDKSNWMKNYTRDEMAIKDDVNPIPIDLWNWGIANRSGRLRTFPENIIKLNLMPRDYAMVTEKGIRYKKMHYSCEKAMQEMWFERARNKGYWKVDISYDPRDMNYIYLRTPEGRDYEQCRLLNKNRYGDKTFDEIEYLLAYEQLEKEKRTGQTMQSNIDLIADIEAIVEVGEKMTLEQKDITLSKAGRVKGIKQHRKNEKMEMRKKHSFDLSKEEPVDESQPAEVTYINQEQAEDDLDFPDNIEFLRRKQRERLHGKKE